MDQNLPVFSTSSTITELKATGTKLRFGNVYEEYRHRIYTYVFYRVGQNQDIAEDVTSDVFLKAYKNFDSYDETYAITTWLFTITRRTLIDHYRTQKDTAALETVELLDTNDPLYRLIHEAISESEVQAAIERLPEQQRDSITAQFFGGQTAKEIAIEQGVSHAAVRKHVSRGLMALREALLAAILFISL